MKEEELKAKIEDAVFGEHAKIAAQQSVEEDGFIVKVTRGKDGRSYYTIFNTDSTYRDAVAALTAMFGAVASELGADPKDLADFIAETGKNRTFNISGETRKAME